jgi:hypothetical protein
MPGSDAENTIISPVFIVSLPSASELAVNYTGRFFWRAE